MDNQIVSTDYLQRSSKYFRYKGYRFVYGPSEMTISENSRVAEYQYVFRDGVEITKVRGTKRIEISGIWIAGPTNYSSAKDKYGVDLFNFGETARDIRSTRSPNIREVKTTAYGIMNIFKKLQDNTSGWLIIPNHGNFITFITESSYKESGNYPGEIEFKLSFVVSNPNPPITEIPDSLRETQEEKLDEEKLLIEHTIVSGDTLNDIATQYGVTLGHLKALNPILFDRAHQGGNLIRSGEVVKIDKSSNAAWIPYIPTKVSPRKVYGNKDIPRDQQANVHIDNKGKEVRGLDIFIGEGNTSKLKQFFRDTRAGDSILVNPEKAEQAFGDFLRDLDSTVKKYEQQKALETEEATKIQKTAGLFPIYNGLIQYPQSRAEIPFVTDPYIANNPQSVA
jgi:LysM repeat protein